MTQTILDGLQIDGGELKVVKILNQAGDILIRNSRTGVFYIRTAEELRDDIEAEPAFTKNTAFNKDFGTTSDTVAEGNDSRILNGQTAFDWGNHADAGYLSADTSLDYLPLTGGTLESSGSTDTLNIDHASGSGLALNITKAGNGEGLKVVKTSGSGLAASITGGVTLLDELNLTTKLADAHIASAATWNAKIGGLIATGQVAFGTAAGVIGGDSGLIWDNVNKRLGVGTNAPAYNLEIKSNSNTTSFGVRRIGSDDVWVGIGTTSYDYVKGLFLKVDYGIRFGSTLNSLSTDGDVLSIKTYGYQRNIISSSGARINVRGYQSPSIIFSTQPTFDGTDNSLVTRMVINNVGNILINTTTDAGFRLDVNGTARITSTLQTDVDAVFNGVRIGRGGGNISTNTMGGDSALNSNTTGSTNTAVGGGALQLNTTGSQSTAVGFNALYSNNGGLNTAVGRNAMFSNTTGGSSVGIGTNVLLNNTIGGSNVGIGNSAGRYIADGTTPLTITKNSVFLGANTRALADNQTNQIVIGHNAIGLGSNSVVLGNDAITLTRLRGQVNMGSMKLDAMNTAPASATATGALGEIRVTATHIYVCTATDTWVRSALTTF
jgi:hypothetical protein